MKKRLFAVLLAVLMIASLSTVAAFAEDAKTVYVATTGDDTNGDGTQDSPYATLSKAASSVNDGDTINIAAGNYAGNVVIAHAVNIVGAGSNQTTITGNLKIAGYSTDDTSVTNKEITVSDIKMIAEEGSNNWGLYFGNGYANHPCWMNDWSLNVTDCAFEGWQYAICLQGGAFTSGDKSVTMSNNTLTVTNTTFADTFCATSVDAAIGELDMENSDFEAAGDNFFVCQQYGNIPGGESNVNNYYSDLNDTTPIQVPINENGNFIGSSFEAVLLDGNGTPKKYGTLPDLITAAEDGDTIILIEDIELASNTSLIIDKAITIQGATDDITVTGSTTNDYSNGLFALVAGSEGSTLKNFTIDYTSSGAQNAAVYFGNGFDGETDEVTTIENVTFNGASTLEGLGDEKAIAISSTYLNNDSSVVISNCDINNFAYGMYFNGLKNVTVTGNNIDGTKYNGVIFAGDDVNYPCDNITVSDNTLTNISYGDYEDEFYSSGITMGDNVSNVEIADNDITMLNGKEAISAGENFYTIVYVVNGAEYYTVNTTVSNGFLTYRVPSNPSMNGYNFNGWDYGNANVEVLNSAIARLTIKDNDGRVGNTYTFTARWQAIANIPDTYDIDLIVSDGGSAKTNLSNASAGTTITVTATPDEGYELDYITVDGERISGTSFKMPAHDVTVRVYFTDGTSTLPFTDVRPNQWFYDAVAYVYTNGMMEGDSATTFNPDGQMTRAMFWAVLGRIDGANITGANWVDTARTWAMSKGVSDGTDPNGLVTREMMVTMLWRYVGEPESDYSLSAYTDANSVSDWAAEAMAWAVENGVISGVSATTLAPQGTATRAQCATIFMRYDADIA